MGIGNRNHGRFAKQRPECQARVGGLGRAHDRRVQVLGIDDRVGSLAPGKDADVAIMSAHPLDIVNARVERVLIGGETVYVCE